LTVPTLDVVAEQAAALREKWERKVEENTGVAGGADRRLVAEDARDDLRKIASNLSRLARETDGLPTEQDD
jgi:hypothetical protein